MQKRARKDLKRLSILPNCLNHFEKTINIFFQTNFMISPALVSENNFILDQILWQTQIEKRSVFCSKC